MGLQPHLRVLNRRLGVAFQAADLDEPLRRAVSEQIRNDFHIPPLPSLAAELHQIASSPEADISAMVRLVERDSQLAGRVVRLASSPAYGASAVTDLRRAAIRLGVHGLRDVAFAALMGQVFRSPALNERMRQEVLHGFVTATTASHVFRELQMESPMGFLCGLLHDIGNNALLAVLAQMGRKDPSWLEAERVEACLAAMHDEVGALVARRWKLPDIVTQVIRHHSSPQQATSGLPAVLAVAAADVVAETVVGLPEDPEEQQAVIQQQALFFQSGLSMVHIPGVLRVAADALADQSLLKVAG